MPHLSEPGRIAGARGRYCAPNFFEARHNMKCDGTNHLHTRKAASLPRQSRQPTAFPAASKRAPSQNDFAFYHAPLGFAFKYGLKGAMPWYPSLTGNGPSTFASSMERLLKNDALQKSTACLVRHATASRHAMKTYTTRMHYEY